MTAEAPIVPAPAVAAIPFVNRVRTAWVFAAVAAFVWLAHANVFVVTNDEGIIWDAASRMVAGQRLYVDFFGYMSPGSYWLQQIAFTLFGVNFAAGRLIVILGFAGQCALLFALTRRLANARTAVVATTLFFLLQFTSPGLITAQHRWDSATLALSAVYLALKSSDTRKAWMPALSGVLIAYATICTPSVGPMSVVILGWFALRPNDRRLAVPYLAGGVAITVMCVALMLATGIFGGFLDQIAWLSANYSQTNVMPYGSIISGYGTLFEGVGGAELIIRAGIVLCLALPAILPVIAIIGWGTLLLRRRVSTPRSAEILLLLAAQAVLIVSAYPRADVMHLAFFASLGYALTAAWAYTALPGRAIAFATLPVAVFALILSVFELFTIFSRVPVDSPVGKIRVTKDALPGVTALLHYVKPAETAFVHPYLPLAYFLTQSTNLARYSYLSPGMMGAREEIHALELLRKSPPRWVLHLPLTRDEFLRVFPSGDSVLHRFETLDAWLNENYEPVPDTPPPAGYVLKRRKQAAR